MFHPLLWCWEVQIMSDFSEFVRSWCVTPAWTQLTGLSQNSSSDGSGAVSVATDEFQPSWRFSLFIYHIHLLDILTSYSAVLSIPVDAALHSCAGWCDTNYHGQAVKCVLTPLQSGLSYPPPTRISRSLSLDGSVLISMHHNARSEVCRDAAMLQCCSCRGSPGDTDGQAHTTYTQPLHIRRVVVLVVSSLLCVRFAQFAIPFTIYFVIWISFFSEWSKMVKILSCLCQKVCYY